MKILKNTYSIIKKLTINIKKVLTKVKKYIIMIISKIKKGVFYMKKQNLKKEKTETNEELMVNRFKKYSVFFEILELFFKAAIIIGAIAIVTIGIAKKESDSDITFLFNTICENVNEDQIPEISNNIGLQKVMVMVDLLVLEIKFIASACVFSLLRKIFTDSINNKTPFTENNVKNMRKMIGAVVVFGASQMSILNSIIFIIIIVTIYQIFNYGYLLQKESDELL